MNQNLIDWIFKQHVQHSSDKLTLLAYAYNSYLDNLTCPTVASIARLTGLSTQTINTATKRLLKDSYIIDTGSKSGKSHVYRFPDEAV